MELRDGVAAFDPVTLRIAAAQLPLVQLPPELDGELPGVLSSLAEVSITPFAVTATIDTGQMTWADAADTEPFTTYRGEEANGIAFEDAQVAELDDVLLARLPMRLGDSRVWGWFAELSEETELEAFQLVTDVRNWMCGYARRAADVDELIIPEQDVQYEAFVKGLDRPTRQKISAVVDERGARVVAETIILMGLPDWSEHRRVVLGERGPVLFWFSEGSAPDDVPFAVVYTQAEAWVGE